MAKLTLLDMVQDILRAIEADEINSIADTPESEDIAYIIRNVYYEMLQWATTPELDTAYFHLEGLSDTNRPNYLRLPDNVEELNWFRYNTRTSTDTKDIYTTLFYCTPEDFYDRVMSRDITESNVVEVTTEDGPPLYVINDKGPEFYTISKDREIICDSYDSSVDTTLQASKTTGGGKVQKTFSITDNFIPDLDAALFPYLLAESKAIAFADIKQTTNNKHERSAREQKVRHQNGRHRFSSLNNPSSISTGPNFGRRKH